MAIARTRRSSVTRILIVNAMVLVAGVVLLELIFGSWWRPNPINQLNLLRDVRLVHDAGHLYPGDSLVSYTRDENGFRGSYPDAGLIDILTIGGSATDQRYISDLQTWQEVLRAAFARDGKQLVVVNAGVDGQSTVGHVRNFEWWFPQVSGLKARFHLFYIGTNDFHTQRDFDELKAAPGLIGRLKESSAIYSLAVKMRGLYDAMVVARVGHTRIDFATETWTDQPRFDNHAAMAQEPVARYRERLRILLAKSRATGARPICVTQATRYYRAGGGQVQGTARPIRFGPETVNGVDYFHLIDYFNRATLEVCGEFDGIALDASGEVAWTDADFYDFVHNTPEGSRKLGEYLHHMLQRYF